jgi:hypothetical protein
MLVIFRRERNLLDVSTFSGLFRSAYANDHLQDTYDLINDRDERK